LQLSIRVLAAVCLFGAGGAYCADGAYPEPSVKAAFLLRIAEYVQWPAPPAGDFVIAVLDRGDMADRLQALVTRPLLGRPVRVRRVRTFEEAVGAQMLYVGNDRRRNLRSLLQSFPARGLLVVSDQQDGLAAGSTINFLLADGRVRFEVSLEAARRAGLTINAALLSVATRVAQ
jgi:hypothetical protein